MVLEDGACVVVDSMATFQLNGHDITLNGDDATIVVKSGGTIRTADGVDLTFSGDGYLQFYEDAIVDLGAGAVFNLDGPGKNHRVMMLHESAQIDIGRHDLELRKGKILMAPNAYLTNDSVRAYIWQTNFVGGSTEDGFKAYAAFIGNNATEFYMGYSDVDTFIHGIVLQNADSIKDQHYVFDQSSFSAISSMGISLKNLERRVRIGNVELQGISNYGHIGINSENVKILEICQTSANYFDNGIKARQCPAVYLSGGNADIEYNTTGLKIDTCNLFVRNNATISNNTIGIDMKGDSSASDTDPEGYLLTIGDLGCGNVINNNDGIIGEDVVLNIDAEINACARGDCSDIAPNRLDGNADIFTVCFEAFHWDTVFAKYNYWDNGQGANAQDYHLANWQPGFGCSKENVALLDDNYFASQPTNCNNSGSAVDEDKPRSDFFRSATNCERTLSGSYDYLVEDLASGYMAFLQKDWSSAKSYLGNVAAEELEDTSYAEGCRQCMYVSRALVHVADIHEGYDSTYTESGKRSRDPKRKEGSTASSWTIYPNPTEGMLTVKNTYDGLCIIELQSITGRVIKKKTIGPGISTVDFGGLENGIYVIYMKSANGKVIQQDKIIKM
jgi:hypothetical protein